jgi:hypothetical protein
MLSRCLLAILVASSALVKASIVPLELLTQYDLAKCLDGSPGGFYHQPALDPLAKDKWVIHLQGSWKHSHKPWMHVAMFLADFKLRLPIFFHENSICCTFESNGDSF